MSELATNGRTRARPLYEAGTEGLRGLCALIVLYTHLFAPYRHVDPGYAPSPAFWRFEAGQGAVLLFFVLSGYVIGLTNDRPIRPAAVRDYAWRRVIRLVPLYLLAVMFSYAVRPTDAWRTVAGNLLFLQNDLPIGPWHVPVLSSNTNLWSLNYEVLYYALFLVVWLAPRLWPLWVGISAAIAVAGWSLPGANAAVATYAAGWIFWLAGFGLARAPRPSTAALHRLPWPSLLVLWLATWHLKPLWAFGHRFGLTPTGSAWMNYSYCDLIPASVAVLMAASNRRPRWSGLLVYLALFIPVGFTAWQAVRHRFMDTEFLPDETLVLAAAVLWFWRPSTAWFVRLAPVGMISYAVYIFQRPVQWLVVDRVPLPSGSAWTFAVRTVVTIGLTLLVSYVGERVLQPRIRRWLIRPRPVVAQAEAPVVA